MKRDGRVRERIYGSTVVDPKEMISMDKDIDWDRYELMQCSNCRLLRDSVRDSVCPQHGKEILKLVEIEIKKAAIKKKNEQDRFDKFMRELRENN